MFMISLTILFLTGMSRSGSTTTWSTSFLAPLTIDAASAPTVSVVFDPIHWINVKVTGSSFDEKPSSSVSSRVNPTVFALQCGLGIRMKNWMRCGPASGT